MAQVKLEKISKRFGDVEAVKEFSLDIADGEFLILVGPSGCGKTTLLRVVAGLEQPTSGEIYINGDCITNMAPKKRDIAMVFQNYALYPHMKVYDNLAFCLKLRKTAKPDIKAQVERTAELLGIGELLTRFPHQLSGGQRQRVAVGRAIIRDPKVFLFDEPLSNLDAKLRVNMRTELLDLHHRLKSTAIYVTHDQMEAMTMGTRIVVMRDGEVQQVDTPKKVYENPSNLFVAGFIGSPAMNFFDCAISQENGDLFARNENINFKLPANKTNMLSNYIGKNLVLGLRPENFAPGSGGQGSDFKAEVRVVELLGSEQLLNLEVGAKRFSARLDPESVYQIGELREFNAKMELAHMFDPESGEAIS
jgi:multiple sugar transport system ATP-binding protein